jgi:uncharacterized repeat protein (TIGR02543 family)
VYVVDSSNNAIKVIDTATNTVTTTISLNSGSPAYTQPVGITVSPDGAHVYVTANGPALPSGTTDGILKIATATNTIESWSTPGLTTKSGISINPAGTRLYLAQANNSSGTVRVVQISDMTIVATISNLNAASGCNGTGWISGTAISRDGTKMYVACNGTNSVIVIDLSNNTVTSQIAGFSSPLSIAVASDDTIHVTNQSTGVSSVMILDGTSYSVLSTVTGFNRPTGIALSSDNEKVYVTNSNSSSGGGGASPNSMTTVSRTYSVVFSDNGSTGGSAPSAGSFTTGGTAFSVPANTGTLVKTGYTFNGWNTAANGSGTAYAAGSSTYSSAASVTLHAQWTVNAPAGGGGSSPAPTVSEEPTTPTTQVPVNQVPFTLDPITNDANPNIPAKGSLPSSSVLLTTIGASGSSTQSINVAFTVDAGRVQTPDFSLSLASRYASATDTPGTPGSLTLYSRTTNVRSQSRAATKSSEPTLDTAGTGFKAGTPLRVYLLPNTLVGELTADAAGNFSASIPVPSGLTPGAQIMQINGFANDGSVRSLSIGVVVKSVAASPAVMQARASVQFASGSAKLTRSGQSQLRNLVSRTGKSGAMSVVGFARGQKLTASAKTLSDARARAVASYLRGLGLKGSYTVRGVWVVGGSVSTGQRVTVVVSYPAAGTSN